MEKYLCYSQCIDFDHPALVEKAAELADNCSSDISVAKRCFEFVRDSIKHSWDYQMNPVTCKASEVLLQGTGFCYAKSHLLAALLRANRIPAGLCYQRLRMESKDGALCLHGLNAVYLHQYGWYRVDARGNKPGVAAEFNPPLEKLAFYVSEDSEMDLPEIWSDPIPPIIRLLTENRTVKQVHDHLPDIEIIKRF